MAIETLKSIIKGEITEEGIESFSKDASIFEVKPVAVVKPQDVDDVRALVKFVNKKKKDEPDLSLTARAAGTDMSGGPLNESIIIDFGNFNRILEVGDSWATSESGVYYRDFERAT